MLLYVNNIIYHYYCYYRYMLLLYDQRQCHSSAHDIIIDATYHSSSSKNPRHEGSALWARRCASPLFHSFSLATSTRLWDTYSVSGRLGAPAAFSFALSFRRKKTAHLWELSLRWWGMYRRVPLDPQNEFAQCNLLDLSHRLQGSKCSSRRPPISGARCSFKIRDQRGSEAKRCKRILTSHSLSSPSNFNIILWSKTHVVTTSSTSSFLCRPIDLIFHVLHISRSVSSKG